MSERHESSDADAVGLSEDVVIHKTGPGGEGFRRSRSGSDPLSSSSDSSAPAELVSSIDGRAGRKEDSELRVAQGLVGGLNLTLPEGRRWLAPSLWTQLEEGVDCISENQDGTSLKIQVTTPEIEAWRYNAENTSEFTRSQSDLDAARQLRNAIEKKVLKASPDTVLALDAMESTRFAHQTVVDAFRLTFGAWARTVRFREIWLVGPTPETVHRLDPEPPA